MARATQVLFERRLRTRFFFAMVSSSVKLELPCRLPPHCLTEDRGIGFGSRGILNFILPPWRACVFQEFWARSG